MRSGKLNKRVLFQKRDQTKNEVGHLAGGWVDIASRWVSIEPISGRELLAAGQVRGEVTHRIRCRYFDGLTFAGRINFKGRIFDIQSAINVRERNAELEILCNEGVTGG